MPNAALASAVEGLLVAVMTSAVVMTGAVTAVGCSFSSCTAFMGAAITGSLMTGALSAAGRCGTGGAESVLRLFWREWPGVDEAEEAEEEAAVTVTLWA